MSRKIEPPTKEWLKREYVENKRTRQDISNQLNVGVTTISQWIKIYNLYIRKSNPFSKKLLEKEYIHNKRTLRDICRQFRVSHSVIVKQLKKNDIHIRQSLIDITGCTFYDFIILKKTKHTKGRTTWLCKCKCGNLRKIGGGSLKTGRHKSCGQCHYHTFIQNTWYASIKRQAKHRKIEFILTKDYLLQLWNQQEGRCALSGFKLNIPINSLEQVSPKCTASLDRIDSLKGYIKGNVQWVHKTINIIKWALPQEEFIYFCKAVAKHQENKI